MSWWVGNSCFSQPEICCGDHCRASFCATRHRSSLYSATAAVRPIVQTGLIGVPGSGRCAPSLVVWRSVGSYDGAWRRSSRCPEQISGWLKQEFATHQDMQISHEAIYRSLFIQTRGVLKKELTAQLRT